MAQTIAARTSSPRPYWLTILSKYPFLAIETVLLTLFVLVALFGPTLLDVSPTEQILARVREVPNPNALLGRDELGRDILARLVYGARFTIGVGLATVLFGLMVGGFLGLISGYYQTHYDTVIMRVMDLLMAFPSILSAIVMIAILGTGVTNVILAVGIFFVPIFARLVRALTLRLSNEQFVDSARAVGASDIRIMRRHILPNTVPTLLVQITYSLGEAIIIVAGLGFLGLGVQPPTPEWGAMLSRAREVMFVAPHVAIMPGLALVFLLLLVNLLGDGLRDLLDPRLRRTP
ncbi:MAG: ABC transporter permease [Anaerolineae bacterium]|nr:ABC transporter permease [Anaerolineae bacterium]